MVAKYVMLADTTRCINCKACEVACRAEWDTRWVTRVTG